MCSKYMVVVAQFVFPGGSFNDQNILSIARVLVNPVSVVPILVRSPTYLHRRMRAAQPLSPVIKQRVPSYYC